MKTVTQWFSCEIPPEYAGRYEFRGNPAMFPLARPIHLHRFDGENWFNTRGELCDAVSDMPEWYQWRGLAEPA